MRHLQHEHQKIQTDLYNLHDVGESYYRWVEDQRKIRPNRSDLHYLPDNFHDWLHDSGDNLYHTHAKNENKPLLWSDLRKETSWKDRYAGYNTQLRTYPRVNNLDVEKLTKHMVSDHGYNQDDIDQIYDDAISNPNIHYWGDHLEKKHSETHAGNEYMDWHKHANKKSILPGVKEQDISRHFSLQHLWPEDEQIQEFRNDNYKNDDVHNMSSDEILQHPEFKEYLNWAHGGEHEHVHTDWLNHKHSNNIKLPFPDESNVARHLMIEHNVDKDSLYDLTMGRLDKIPDDRYDELSLMDDKTFEAQPEVQETMHRFHDKDHEQFRGLPNPRYVRARPHTHGG